jgi:hypothetical protein
VVVFGAGEAGRRALRRLRAEGTADVVAFVDNSVAKHGTTLEDLPIISPADLVRCGVDRVVVASQASAQILPQLRALGIPRDSIDLYQLSNDSVQPAPASTDEWPRLLVLTDECISPSHGTGAVLLRHFAGYPRERLLHGYLRLRGDSFLPYGYKVAPAGETGGTNSRTHGDERPPLSAEALIQEIQEQHGRIDLVYSNFYGDVGLAFLADLAATLDPSIPIVHHAQDLLTTDHARYDRLLRQISPRLSELWAIGPGLAERVSQATGRPCTLMNTFSCEITPTWKTEHRDADAGFTAVMLGNSHMPWVLDRLRGMWAEVRQRCGAGPIQWFAYPTSVLWVERAGVRVDPDIEYYGYLSDRALHRHLRDADMAIIPFNIEEEPEEAYARYSIPSRLTELLNAGLPIFAAAGGGTDTSRFILSHGIGECSTIADTGRFTSDLISFVRDTDRRRALGLSGRRFAEQQCDIRNYRTRLLTRLGALTGRDIPIGLRPTTAVASARISR